MSNTGSQTYAGTWYRTGLITGGQEGLVTIYHCAYDLIGSSEWATNTLEQGVTVTETASDNQI